MKKPYFLKVFFYTGVAMATGVLLWSFVNRFLPTRNAALGPNGAQVIFTPSSGNIANGGQQVIKVRINPITPTNKFAAFDLSFTASGNIKFVTVGNNAAFKDPFKFAVTDTTIGYARGLHVNTGDPSDTIPTEVDQPFIEFDITVQGTGNGPGTITFQAATSEVTGTLDTYALENTTASYQVGAGGGATDTPPVATSTVAPSVTQPPGGGTCTDGLPAVYFNAIGYSASYNNGTVTFSGTGGKIVIYQANVPYWGPTWAATAPPVVVTNTKTVEAPYGDFQVDLIKSDAEVLASPAFGGPNYFSRGDLLAAVNGRRCLPGGGVTTTPGGGGASPTVEPGTSVTPGGGATVTPPANENPASMTFNARFRLQGILKKPLLADGEVFQIKLVGPSNVLLNGVFTPDADGIYTGQVSANAIPGTYYILVKGPRHIQRKFCEAVPIETKPGTYRCGSGAIQLKAGTNTLDFSQVAILVGDLPMQDGVVDSYDFSYIRQTLGSTKQSELQVADLNRDGIIDTQDMSLVLQALSVKYDEE